MELALGMLAEVRKKEKKALQKQQEEKQRKQDMLRKKKLLVAQSEYADALTYIKMYHSPTFWRNVRKICKNFSKLKSKTAKRGAVKEQI